MTRGDDWAEWERRRQERLRRFFDRFNQFVNRRLPAEWRERPVNRREKIVQAVAVVAYAPVVAVTAIWFGFGSPVGFGVLTAVAVLFLTIDLKLRRWARRTG